MATYQRVTGTDDVYDVSGDKPAYVPYDFAKEKNIWGQVQDVGEIKGLAMTPESLAKTSPIGLTGPVESPAYNIDSLQTAPAPDLQLTPKEQEISGLSSSLQGFYNALTGKSDFQRQQEEKFGVGKYQTAINDLSSELMRLKNESAAIPLALDKRIAETGTILSSAYTSEQNKRQRDVAIAALGVSTLLSAAQGQLANAQSLAEKAVNEKYGPVLEKIDAIEKNLKIIQNDPATTIEDRNRARKQLEFQEKEKERVRLQSEEAKLVWDIATTAAANSQTFKPSPEFPSLSATLKAISNAKTKEEALQTALRAGLVVGKKGESDNTQVVNTNGRSYLINTATGAIIKDLGIANSVIDTPGKKTATEKYQEAASSMSSQLSSVAGADGYVSPDSYKKAKKAWVSKGYKAADFDEQFSIFTNPENPNYY